MKILSEFREFALKGNVVDLAVGVIIGAAFGAVVTSLVQNVMMPPLGWAAGGLDFQDKIVTLRAAALDANGKITSPAVVISYGKFLNSLIAFLIQAIAVFALVKALNVAKRKPQPVPDQPAPLTKDQELLQEIRDAIRARANA